MCKRIEIDEAQHELERAAQLLEAAAEESRSALRQEWQLDAAVQALLHARACANEAKRLLERELRAAGIFRPE